MSFPLITQGMMNCVAFGVAGHVLGFFRNATGRDPNYMHIFLAGSIGGATGLVIQIPTELVKTVLQSQIQRTNGKLFLSCIVLFYITVFLFSSMHISGMDKAIGICPR